jgi:hypothetical protein
MLSSKMTQSIKIQYTVCVFSRNSFSSVSTKDPRTYKKQITVQSINCDPLRAPLAGHHSPRLAIPSSPATAVATGTDPTTWTWTCTTSPARPSSSSTRSTTSRWGTRSSTSASPPLPHGLSVRERRTLPTGIEILRLLISVELHMVC